MSHISKIEKSHDVVVHNPDNLLAIAVQSGANIEQLEKLMVLKERHDSAIAKKAFYKDMAAFQSMVPTIKKTSSVSFGTTHYMFAPLGSIAEQIRVAMGSCGFSYRYEQNHENGIKVKCIVTHIDGYSESTTMQSAVDTSGGKNGIQGIGSTVTYLQRYTLISVLGLTTAEQDIDAQVAIATGETIDFNQIELIKSACQTQKRDLNKLLNWIGVTQLKNIPTKEFKKVCGALHMGDQ